jgi:hypothetical protein
MSCSTGHSVFWSYESYEILLTDQRARIEEQRLAEENDGE